MKKMILSVGGKEIQCEEEWPAPSPATIGPVPNLIMGYIREITRNELTDTDLWVEIDIGDRSFRVAIQGEPPAWIFDFPRVCVNIDTGIISPDAA